MDGAGGDRRQSVTVAYIRHARRHPTPLISLSLFKTHTFSVGIAGNLATRWVPAACRF
jgi:hypothetical protein